MRRSSVNDATRLPPVSRPKNNRKISNALSSERSAFSHRDENVILTSRNSVTVSFSYAGAVERALRHRYNVSAFSVPPTASARRSNAGFVLEVTRLPDIYSDYTQVNQLQTSNRLFIEKLRQESTANQNAFDCLPEINENGTLMTSTPATTAASRTSSKQQRVRMKRQRSRHQTSGRSSPALKLRTSSFTRLPPIN